MIESSLGIGRILYCVMEHAFYSREGSEAKTVFRSALTCLVLPVPHSASCKHPYTRSPASLQSTIHACSAVHAIRTAAGMQR